MDFVASRADEQRFGWRSRVAQFLRELEVTVFDPWFKPEVRGFHEYGAEDHTNADQREAWTFAPTREGAEARSRAAEQFWPALHVDLRMVDTSDFVIAYCPTNIYSVGTPHEIIVARQQRKPVLFVSPPVALESVDALRAHLVAVGDDEGDRLLDEMAVELPIKANPRGVPSLWYMPLIGGEHFFDGFGFAPYCQAFGWQPSPLDEREQEHPLEHPLLPFLEGLTRQLPKKWDRVSHAFVENDDWMLFQIDRLRRVQAVNEPTPTRGAEAPGSKEPPRT